MLATHSVGRLPVAGAQTDACIRSTLHGAPPPEQVITYTNLYWRWHNAPGRRGGTVETAQVRFAAEAARLQRVRTE